MIEKIKIETIDIRSGVSKAGKDYYMPVIMTGDGRKISMYIDKEYDLKYKNLDKIKEWKEGDEVEVSIEQNGEYLNFSLPSKTDLLMGRVFELEGRLDKLEDVIKKATKKK